MYILQFPCFTAPLPLTRRLQEKIVRLYALVLLQKPFRKYCFCYRKCDFEGRKSQNFPPAAGLKFIFGIRNCIFESIKSSKFSACGGHEMHVGIPNSALQRVTFSKSTSCGQIGTTPLLPPRRGGSTSKSENRVQKGTTPPLPPQTPKTTPPTGG